MVSVARRVALLLGIVGCLGMPALGQIPALRAGTAAFDPRLTTFGDPNDVLYTDTPSFLDGLAKLVVERPDGTFGCSGALTGSGGHVLTAAHCVSDLSGMVTATSVTATFTAAAGAPLRMLTSNDIFLADGWDGDFRHGSDLALLQLPSPVSATIYDIVRDLGAGIGETVTLAGFGRSGNGNQGSAPIAFGTLRFGTNKYDTVWSASDVVGSPYAYDFDNGTAAQDTIGNLIPGLEDLGSGAAEVLIAPGDSGGPSFFGGRIIGVHSFGGTFGSPYDINSLLDASFGELGGDVQVALHASWIDSVTAVPEPESYALMIVGLGIVVAAAGLRRRRSSATR